LPARTVICLHGLGRSPADWDGVRGGLERFGRVEAPFLPRSPAGALAAAGRATPAGAIVVAHSIGGVVALQLAAARPRDLKAIVLASSFFPPARNGRGMWESIRDYAGHRVAYLRERPTTPRAPGAAPTRTGGLPALATVARLGLRRSEYDALAEAIAVPVLVVHAPNDHHVPVDFALAAARRAGWDVALLAAGGHRPHVAVPERWLDAVLPWLGRRFPDR
jgi:pimeloyl-ACP methyl ester carboxylesterase